MEVLHIYISSGHNYRDHEKGAAGKNAIREVNFVRCIAGRGIEGDRYFDYRPDFKGQITFFADEVYRSLREQFNVKDKPPSVFRRNVITRGADLESLIGKEFQIQGIRFVGTESCRPCFWLEEAFCPGTEAALENRGGLRARILNDGILRVM